MEKIEIVHFENGIMCFTEIEFIKFAKKICVENEDFDMID